MNTLKNRPWNCKKEGHGLDESHCSHTDTTRTHEMFFSGLRSEHLQHDGSVQNRVDTEMSLSVFLPRSFSFAGMFAHYGLSPTPVPRRWSGAGSLRVDSDPAGCLACHPPPHHSAIFWSPMDSPPKQG